MLTVSNCSKTYPNGVRALQNVDLTIGKGMFGLLGPNGAGKSSLMRTIATLQEPDQGTITFNGIDVLQNPGELRNRLGYLPQEFGVYPRISALDLLDHLAVLKGVLDKKERRDMVHGLLQQVNLYNVRKKAVRTFSGGMKQRFGIAQALLGEPQLIIVDEPTAGLDPEERKRFLNLLSEIGRNVVVLLSTHIVEDVRDLCSRMAILDEGKVVLEGSPAHLVDSMIGRVWRKQVERGQQDALKDRHRVISTHLLAGETRVHVLADTCPEPGFEPISPTLEDVYFATLNRAA
ncbi:MAG: ABC transporter ATP-binding protein [Acidobacteriota bacterium]|nr:ABC transporter ATP-binding protein [Acidobacteriota bacterium]